MVVMCKTFCPDKQEALVLMSFLRFSQYSTILSVSHSLQAFPNSTLHFYIENKCLMAHLCAFFRSFLKFGILNRRIMG